MSTLSPRAKRISNGTPEWVLVVGVCLVLAQGIAALVWAGNALSDPVKVTYLVTGESSDAELRYYTPEGIESGISATRLPFRIEFQAGDDELLRIEAQNDDEGKAGALICTILLDGKVVEQERATGTTAEASCSGTAGSLKPIPGAKVPQLTGAVAPEVRRLTETTKLKRYPGRGSKIVGRVTDPEARLSFGELGRPWEPFDTSSYGPYSGHQRFSTESDWQATLATRVADPSVMGAYTGPNKLRDVAAMIQDARQFDSYRDDTTGRDVASQPFKVGEHPAWALAREMTINDSSLRATTELSVVVVVDTGRERPSMLWMSIPNTHKQYWSDVNKVIESLQVVD